MATGRGRWGEEQQGGQQQGHEEGGNEEGDNVERDNVGWNMGRGQWGKRWEWGGGEEGARGREISRMDMMECLRRHRL